MQTLPTRLSRCVLEQEVFNHGMEYVSHLDLDNVRKDYCLKCWEKSEKPVQGHFWKGKIPPKKEKKRLPDEKALDLFRKTEDPRKRFVLALYLQRKRQLVRRTQTLYEIPETGEVFDVEIVLMSSEEGAEIAKEIDESIHKLFLGDFS